MTNQAKKPTKVTPAIDWIEPGDERYERLFKRWVEEKRPSRFESGRKTYQVFSPNGTEIFKEVGNTGGENQYTNTSLGGR